MATKRTPTKKTRPAKKAPRKQATERPARAPTKKRARKAPRKDAAKRSARGQGSAKKVAPKRANQAPAKKAPRKKAAKRPARAQEPAKKPARVPVPVSAPAPPRKDDATRLPRVGAFPHGASYLEGVPHDNAELVSGLLQVVRGAAKDLKTLVTQAIDMRTHKNDRSNR